MNDSQPMDGATADLAPEDRLAVLFIRIAGTRYAIESGHVGRVVETFDSHPMPRTPPSITGVTDVDGKVAAVVDLPAVLDQRRSPGETDGPIVVLYRDGDGVGLHVHAVGNFVSTDVSRIEPVDRLRRPVDGDDETVSTEGESRGEDEDENCSDEAAVAERSAREEDTCEETRDVPASGPDPRWSKGSIVPENEGDTPVAILDVPYLLETVANESELRKP